MSKIEFNGIELELDLMDADVMEKFEDGLAKTAEECKRKITVCRKEKCRMHENPVRSCEPFL